MGKLNWQHHGEGHHKLKGLAMMSATNLTNTHLKAHAQQKYGMRSYSVMEPHDLVVNLNPDVPLKVPLDQSSLTKWQKVEILKKKNLDRYETVA